MGLLIFYLFLALFISFLCSILEAVLLSTPAAFLNVKAKKGIKSANTFIKLKNNVERPLAAILSLNTIAHTIGAAGVGAEATRIWGEAKFGIISAVLTFLILIFSEIIPKTIGARYWRKLALGSGIIMKWLVILTYPLVIMTGYISRLFARGSAEVSVSREEISALANIGRKEGVIKEKENLIIQNIVRLKSINISQIMTPRVVVTTAEENMSLKEFLLNKEYLHYSRIPVYKDSMDNITGYVFRQKVFEKLAENETKLKLKDIRRDIVVADKSQSLMNLWEVLLEKKEHIALIVDEFGGMDGIVTMEDIIETLLGLEIVDERDKEIDMQEYARARWRERKTKYNILVDLEEFEDQ
jgi:CBS domain containing-hemolysin-like protein